MWQGWKGLKEADDDHVQEGNEHDFPLSQDSSTVKKKGLP
jgi:hypothetical protein